MSRTRKPRNGSKPGHLVIIGGREDRTDDMAILGRFVELAHARRKGIAVITAASEYHDDMMDVYERAFGELGVKHIVPVRVESRADAEKPELEDIVCGVGGVFMTGGDQKRLVALVGGTVLARAMHHAFARGTTIAGTSAGASAISEHMLASGEPVSAPNPMHPMLGVGLGFLRRAAVDQHFSERRRLGRLLSVVASNPYLLGMGIDEDTAVVVEPNAGVEVLGSGAVTIIDGREVVLNSRDVNESDHPQLSNIRLHLLPAGFHYRLDGAEEAQPRSLPEVIRFITSVQTASAP